MHYFARQIGRFLKQRGDKLPAGYTNRSKYRLLDETMHKRICVLRDLDSLDWTCKKSNSGIKAGFKPHIRHCAHTRKDLEAVVDTHLSKFCLCCHGVSVGRLSNISLLKRSNNVPQVFPVL